MFDRANLYRIAPFGAYVFFMLLEDMLLKFGWEANDLRLLYAVKITVVAGLLWAMRSAYSELRWPVGTSFRTWAVAIVAGIVVFVAWINLTADWMVTVSYTHLRAHETVLDLVCRLLLEKKNSCTTEDLLILSHTQHDPTLPTG